MNIPPKNEEPMDLAEGRRRIDEIDSRLLPLLAERMAVSVEIGRYKAKHGLPVTDSRREESLIERCRERVPGEYADDAEQLYRLIFRLSKAHQRKAENE